MSESPGSESTDGLQPTPPHGRVFGTVSYVLMWWSSLIVIQAFVIGQALLPPIGQLNLLQALVVVITAGIVYAVMFALNGQAGLKYGIPFAVQTRSSFGVRGAKIVELLRILPAIGWYGIGTWIAALSVNGIVKALTGFTMPDATGVYFVAALALQTALAYRGIRTMKWFNVMGSVVIGGVMAYVLFHIITTYGFPVRETWQSRGTWGLPFWIGATAAIGGLASVMLNISDMTRHLESSQRANWVGHFAGVVPPWLFMVALGMASGAALGIWDPVEALMKLSPNTATMIVLLVFVLITQFTTNLTLNILPPALILMDIFKIRWTLGVIITGILGALSAPWLLLANSETFFKFILYYSGFFGPILGVMLADYYILRSQTLDVQDHYDVREGSPFWYSGGFNVAALVATFVPGVVTMVWFLEMSWLVGLPAGFVLYLILTPYIGRSRAPAVRADAVR